MSEPRASWERRCPARMPCAWERGRLARMPCAWERGRLARMPGAWVRGRLARMPGAWVRGRPAPSLGARASRPRALKNNPRMSKDSRQPVCPSLIQCPYLRAFAPPREPV